MKHVLAGDVGGTKTVLCLYETGTGHKLREIHKAVYPSAAYDHFDTLLEAFLGSVTPSRPLVACLGIAGPVVAQRCEATNLPWVIDAAELAARCGIGDVVLLNDLEAAALGMLHLSPEEFVELNPAARPQAGHVAVIAAGTGLGEAMLAHNAGEYTAMPTEGGHCDFGPNSAQEDALLVFLRERFGGHVSVERILAGAGFGNIYDFLRTSGHAPPDPVIEAEMAEGDRNAVISRHGLAGLDPLCTETLRLFVRLYGSEAGNLALKCLPRGGIYIGGGIGPKIRPALEAGGFMEGFLDKGRMTRAIAHIPVRLSLNPEAPLIGAAHSAVKQLHTSAN